MFKKSKQLSDTISQFMMNNYQDKLENLPNSHSVDYDQLIKSIELILSDFAINKSRLNYFSSSHNSSNVSLRSTQKIGFIQQIERNASQEMLPTRNLTPLKAPIQMSNKEMDRMPLTYKPTLDMAISKKYQLQRNAESPTLMDHHKK